MLGAYFVRKRRKKGLSSRVHFVFLVLSLRLKKCLRFVLRIILPIHLWGTSFQQATWNELIKIPYGTTISYKALAQKVGNEQAVRAVANANNKNFISIIIPCHRVIGSKGELVGYAGGLNKKAFLLQLEQQNQHNKSASLFKEDDFLK